MASIRTNPDRFVDTPRRYPIGSYQRRERRTRFTLHSVLLLYSLILIIPTLIVISSSLSTENDIAANGFVLFPRHFSLAAYQYLFNDPSTLVNAYLVSITVTVLGTLLTVLINSMLAYVLTRRHFRFRRFIGLFVICTTLFQGGLVPTYILMTTYLHLQDTLTVLIVPGLVNVWYLFLLRAYFGSLPPDLFDAAKLDGANEWHIYLRLVLPLSTPALATVALFAALGYWNDWYTALLYISDQHLYPLQYLLYQVQGRLDFLASSNFSSTGFNVQVPQQTLRLALVVLTTGPIVLVFLPLQRFFVRGITMGGLKGD